VHPTPTVGTNSSTRHRSAQPIIIELKPPKFLKSAYRKSWDFRPQVGPYLVVGSRMVAVRHAIRLGKGDVHELRATRCACKIGRGRAIEAQGIGMECGMGGEAKTLKQIEAAESVVADAMELLDTYSPRRSREVSARFVYAAMTVTRKRLREVKSELFHAHLRAATSPENTTIVSREAFEDVRLFRAIGPARLSDLLKERLTGDPT
jgi:hypothetical protein